MRSYFFNNYKRIYYYSFSIITYLLVFNIVGVYADTDTYTYQAEDIWKDDGGASTELQHTASVEFTSYISTDPDQEPEDAIKKNELRGRATLRYGSGTSYFYTSSYAAVCSPLINEKPSDFHEYSEDLKISRNLRVSAPEWEIAANEFYFNYSTDTVRFRIGNQVFDWGVANIISPTTYFNPGDFRELMFNMIQEDEMTGIPSLTWVGTPALSVMLFPSDLTCELVVTPIHTPMLFPLNNGFWSVEMENSLYSVYFEETEDLEMSAENTGVGIRIAGNAFDADVSLSAYHGPDKEAVLIPYGIGLVANASMAVHVRPTYYTVNKIGMDVSYARDGFGFQFEAVYSPDMSTLPEINLDRITEIELPIEALTTQYVQYAVSVNYLVPMYKLIKHHEGISVVFAEYSYLKYYDEAAAGSLFPNLLALGYMDSFFDNKFKTAIMILIDRNSGSYVVRPQIEYKIRNDLSFQVSYTDITGKALEGDNLIESAFYYFRDNDIVLWKIRYTF